jgi:hypothetical protein
MSRLDFEAAEYGKGKSGLENYFMEFPNMIETEGMQLILHKSRYTKLTISLK